MQGAAGFSRAVLVSILIHGLALTLTPDIGLRTEATEPPPKVLVVTVTGVRPQSVVAPPPLVRHTAELARPAVFSPLVSPPELSSDHPSSVTAAPIEPRVAPASDDPAAASPREPASTGTDGGKAERAAPMPVPADPNALPIPVPFYKLTAAPHFLRRAIPVFPPGMRSLGRGATVKVEVLIDEHGTVRKVTVVNSAGADFDQEAIIALMASRFSPGQLNHQPVAVVYRTQVEFRLQ